jgi:hypothetical protein
LQQDFWGMFLMSVNLLEPQYDTIFCESAIEYMLKGGASIDVAAQALYIYNNKYNIINIERPDLQDKIYEWVYEIREEMLGKSKDEQLKQTLQHALHNVFLGIGEGTFSTSDCYRELNLKTADEKGACRMALTRLVAQRVIEREGSGRSGQYRIINNKKNKIDITKADTKPIIVKLPLNIHEYVNIYKGNIIIISGESNAGKTGFCLNAAKMNREMWHVNYLTSEMQDGTELRIRLEAFNEPLTIWDSVDFVYRTDTYPDVIDPDGLNIIDYLDEGKGGEAYQVPRRIREISEKLKDGVAIICLQKHSQKAFAFGGEGTMNTARLYLSITRQGILRIEKAKMWRNHNVNPNGLHCRFKLVAGCKFIIDGTWRKND